MNLKRTIPALVGFGVAFGLLEACVVIALREVFEPLRRAFHPHVPASDMFPLLSLEQLGSLPGAARLLRVEILREFSTIAMLAAAASMCARTRGQFVAAFFLAFGVWDIFFYVFLKLLAGWPASILTWDLLFLIPVPWYGPVLAPVLVSLIMTVCGIDYLARPFRVRPRAAAAMLAGAMLILASMLWDARNLMAGGLPNPFPWWLFAPGGLLIPAAYYSARRTGGAAASGSRISLTVSKP